MLSAPGVFLGCPIHRRGRPRPAAPSVGQRGSNRRMTDERSALDHQDEHLDLHERGDRPPAGLAVLAPEVADGECEGDDADDEIELDVSDLDDLDE